MAQNPVLFQFPNLSTPLVNPDDTIQITWYKFLYGLAGSTVIGAATGDVSGTWPFITVTGIGGEPLNGTVPFAGNVLLGTGSAWQTTTISGAFTLNGSGVATLSPTGVTAGTTGATGATVPVLTINAGGQITAWSNVASGGTAVATSFATPGTFVYTIPTGCSVVWIRLWGGGAAATTSTGGSNTQSCTGGGGAGAYAEKTLTIPTGTTTLSVIVGTGGISGAGGTASSVSGTGFTTITAGGGSFGPGNATGLGSQGGLGGTATGGDINITGGQGGFGLSLSGQGVGGTGGMAPGGGGTGGNGQSSANGLSGSQPGGGGGGGGGPGNSTGGFGGNGLVIIVANI